MTRTLIILMSLVGFLGLELKAADHHKLDEILASRSDEQKARDQFRHPKEVMELFGIKKGMTVVDALPGSWYGNIVMPLIGGEGRYIGTRYGAEMSRIQNEGRPERLERALNFPTRFLESAKKFGPTEDRPAVSAYLMGEFPADLKGQVDVYMFMRALHHLNRYETRFLDEAAVEAFNLVKPGGVVGIVQHRAAEDMPDDWAKGNNGYIKQSRVIAAFEAAGFTLETASEVNANPKDKPTTSDYVWRLPPAGGETPELKAIGESDRMTLVFKKPE